MDSNGPKLEKKKKKNFESVNFFYPSLFFLWAYEIDRQSFKMVAGCDAFFRILCGLIVQAKRSNTKRERASELERENRYIQNSNNCNSWIRKKN